MKVKLLKKWRRELIVKYTIFVNNKGYHLRRHGRKLYPYFTNKVTSYNTMDEAVKAVYDLVDDEIRDNLNNK